MENPVNLKILYKPEGLIVKISCSAPNERTCLDMILPKNDINSIMHAQQWMINKLEETAEDLIEHNIKNQEIFLNISAKMQTYPDLVRGIYEDLLAIQKSTRRMKAKLGLPVYKPSEND